jgi:hypothetical protein
MAWVKTFLYQNTREILEIQYGWADALHLKKYPQFLWPQILAHLPRI